MKAFVLWFVLLLTFYGMISAAAQSAQINPVSCPDGTFQIINDTLQCVTCAEGYSASGGNCVLSNAKVLNTSTPQGLTDKVAQFIDDTGAQLIPENPSIGRIIVLAASIILAYIVAANIYSWIVKK